MKVKLDENVDEAGRELHRAKARLTPATAQAFQVQLLTAQRPGEVRRMRWADVDLDNMPTTRRSAKRSNAGHSD